MHIISCIYPVGLCKIRLINQSAGRQCIINQGEIHEEDQEDNNGGNCHNCCNCRRFCRDKALRQKKYPDSDDILGF